jgi:hypothetical protein
MAFVEAPDWQGPVRGFALGTRKTGENVEKTQESSFSRLNAVNVSGQLEKKGAYSYLSWPYAVAELRKVEPNAHWEVKRFGELPFLQTECGFFVEVAVTVSGVTLSQLHPVLDAQNRTMMAPSAFDINRSIQRALVKGIALHGLGLGIFAGEDLPLGDQPEPEAEPARTAAAKRSTQLKQVATGLSAEQQAKIMGLVKETGADLTGCSTTSTWTCWGKSKRRNMTVSSAHSRTGKRHEDPQAHSGV